MILIKKKLKLNNKSKRVIYKFTLEINPCLLKYLLIFEENFWLLNLKRPCFMSPPKQNQRVLPTVNWFSSIFPSALVSSFETHSYGENRAIINKTQLTTIEKC